MFDPIAPVLIALMTAGLKEFSEKVLKRPLDASASASIVVIVGALIYFGNGIAPLLPADVLPALSRLITLVVAVASAFGVHAAIKGAANALRNIAFRL